MKYPGYFLIVWDFIRYAREQSIPVGPGRGSAAGSLVAYCMEITDIDPLQTRAALRALPEPGARQHAGHRHRLLHEPARRGDRVRDAEVRREQVAQIITFNTMAAKAAIKDVGARWTCRTARSTALPS